MFLWIVQECLSGSVRIFPKLQAEENQKKEKSALKVSLRAPRQGNRSAGSGPKGSVHWHGSRLRGARNTTPSDQQLIELLPARSEAIPTTWIVGTTAGDPLTIPGGQGPIPLVYCLRNYLVIFGRPPWNQSRPMWVWPGPARDR